MTPGGWVALITLGCYSAFTALAYGRVAHVKPAQGDLMAFVDAKLNAYTPRPTEVVLRKLDKNAEMRRRQSEVLAQVYGITDNNMDSYERWWQ
jgi:hypothetical protein